MLSKYWDKKGFDWKSIRWERRSDAEPSDLVREASVNVSASLCIVGTNQHNPPHPQPLERVFDISLFGINSTQQLNSIWVSNLLIMHVDSGYFGIYIAYPQHIHLYRHIQPQRYWALFWHFLVTKFTSFWNAHSPTLPYMNKFVYDTSDQSHTLKSPRSLVNASHWCLHGDFRWLTWSQTAADSPVVLFPEASVPLDG